MVLLARNDHFEVEDCKTSDTDEALLRLGMQLRERPVKKEVLDTSHDSQLALSKENSKSSSCNPVVKGFDEMDVGESNSLVENPAGLANSFQKEEALEGYTRTKGNSSVANSQLKKGSKRKLKQETHCGRLLFLNQMSIEDFSLVIREHWKAMSLKIFELGELNCLDTIRKKDM